MLDTGLSILGNFRTVCYVEREAFAASQLVALMASKCLDEAPVWSDLATFNGRQWRGRVDCIIGGLPCQPYSVVGKRIGNDDQRSWGDGDGPIPHALRIIREVRPAMVFLENVPAWVTGGFFQPVAEELLAMGYRVERPLFVAAEDVGAAHKRERAFILAHRDSIKRSANSAKPNPRADWRHNFARSKSELEHTKSIAIQRRSQLIEPTDGHSNGSGKMGNANNEDVQRGGQNENTKRREKPHGHAGLANRIFAPGPEDSRWTDIINECPWLAPATFPRVRMLVNGRPVLVDASRNYQLRAIGNGAVPLGFALAVETLAREAGINIAYGGVN